MRDGSSAPRRRENSFICLRRDNSFPKESTQKRLKIRDFDLLFLSFCLRRVTFVSSDKSNQKRHSRGKGFRFPFPLENPPSLKRPNGEGSRPLPFGNPTGALAIIKSRLCRKAAKVGGGQRPLFRKRSCHACTALHFRAKAAAKREAETMQHLGEISTAQRSRGKTSEISCGRRRVRKSKNVVFGGVSFPLFFRC